MPNVPSLPAIDVNTCADWTENDITLYQALPFHLAKIQVETKQTYPTFSKMVKKRRWKQNQGPVLRGVRVNKSPIVRQFANPRLLTQTPLSDMINVRETTVEAQLRWHKFLSPIFNWYPSFNDFWDHIEDTGRDISEKVEQYNEEFIRGMMFHMCPFMLVCNADGTVSLVNAPYWSGSGTFDGGVNQGKTPAFLTANMPTGPLRLSSVEMAMTIMETDLGIPFFSGSEISQEDKALDGKFLLITDSEGWNNLIYDPYVLQNKSVDMNIVNNGFRGSFFGRSTSRLESLPLRYTNAGLFEEPQLRQADDDANEGETLPNPDYTTVATSPVRVNWLCGKNGFESIETGPPPSLFTSDSFPNAPSMDWSGVPRLTKQILLQCIDSLGNVNYDLNADGEYLRFRATQTFGILATQRRNCIPLVSQRKRGPGPAGAAE